MADIPVTISRGKKFLNGATPVVPGYIVGDAPDPNQSSSDGPSTFLGLTDVDAPSAYVGQAGKVWRVNAGETKLEAYTIPTVDVLGTQLTGYTVGANTALADTDTILGAFQKVQGQINARVSGTIASGQVAFGTGVNTIGGDSVFVWDNVNKRIGIGRSSPAVIFDALNDSSFTIIRLRGGNASGQGSSIFFTQGASNSTLLAVGDGANMVGGAVNNAMIFCNVPSLNFSFSGTNRFQMTSTGSMGVNTISPTNTLDVNGTARIRTIANLGSAATNVLVPSATGVLSLRTVSEFRSDLGLSSTITGTGTDTYIPKWNGTNSINNSILKQQGSTQVHVLGYLATTSNIFPATLGVYGTLPDFEESNVWIRNLLNNFDTNPTVFYDSIRMERVAKSGTTFPSMASMAVNRYENSGQAGRTGFRLALIHGDTTIPDREMIRVHSGGEFFFYDGSSFNIGTVTGLKIANSNTQKLAFWNATPIVQPLESALANTPNSGDANTDALITALKNIILNTGLGRSA